MTTAPDMGSASTVRQIIETGRLSCLNREKLASIDCASCYHCERHFSLDAKPIEEWIDGDQTALCPYCGIDTVLPGYRSAEWLKLAYDYWFEHLPARRLEEVSPADGSQQPSKLHDVGSNPTGPATSEHLIQELARVKRERDEWHGRAGESVRLRRERDEARASLTAESWRADAMAKNEQDVLAEFRNFHRSLCARFGYSHDPEHFRRDQVSLEEHIASSQTAAEKLLREALFILDECDSQILGGCDWHKAVRAILAKETTK